MGQLRLGVGILVEPPRRVGLCVGGVLEASGADLAGRPGELPDGTVVTLRFADGSTEILRVVTITEEIAEDEETITITTGSPLGRALAGAGTGTEVTYRTPAGTLSARTLRRLA